MPRFIYRSVCRNNDYRHPVINLNLNFSAKKQFIRFFTIYIDAIIYKLTMRYFFHHFTSDAFANTEFGIFTGEHFIWMIIAAVALALSLFIFRNIDDGALFRFIRITAIVLLVSEVVKIVIILYWGNFDIGQDLPLWLSSMFVYLLPFVGFAKGRLRQHAINSIVSIYFVGGVLTMIMPLILYYYPLLNFFSFHSLIYHWLMIFIALLLLIRGHVNINLKQFHFIIVPFLIMAVIALPVNAIFDGDYMFLTNGNNSAFHMFYTMMPWAFYALTVLALHIAYIFLTAVAFKFADTRIRKYKSHKSTKISSGQ